MAITQPSYPVETNELVTHVGAYTDTAAAAQLATHSADTTAVHGIANTALLATSASVTAAISTANGYTDSSLSTHTADSTAVHGISNTAAIKGCVHWTSGGVPARPTGFASVEWIGPDDPDANAADGDTWIPTAAP